MTTLHLVRTSPFKDNTFAMCLSVYQKEDKVILMDDACYALHHPSIKSINSESFIVIEEHITARAIDNKLGLTSCKIEDIAKTIFAFERTITWQ